MTTQQPSTKEAPSIVEYIEGNYGSIECAFYAGFENVAYGAAGASLYTGNGIVAAGLAGLGLAAGYTAAYRGCAPPPEPLEDNSEMCWGVNGCEPILAALPPYEAGINVGAPFGKEILSVTPGEPSANNPNANRPTIAYIDCNGVSQTWRPNANLPSDYKWGFFSDNCAKQGSGGEKHNPGDPLGAPTLYDDGDGCTWAITPVDAYVDESGVWHTYYTAIANDPACGGPFGYWSDGTGPRFVNPEFGDPDGGPPPPPGWEPRDDDEGGCSCDHIDAKFAEQTTKLNEINSTVNNINEILSKETNGKPWYQWILDGVDATDDILEIMERFFGEEQKLPATEYLLQGVCEDVSEDDPEQPITTAILPEAQWAIGLTDRLDALAFLLQAHLGYRTPTCGSQKPVLEGDFRTISFRSDEVSPYGKSRLRKRLRYRSTSGVGLAQVVDHWKDFTFNAGSVCVKHTGSPWGTITVWAATADEGKRVIRHAAGESGLDPDQDGRWIVGGSNSPRLGVSGTMRVDTKGGYYWITARDGSDARPIVALT